MWWDVVGCWMINDEGPWMPGNNGDGGSIAVSKQPA